MRRDIEGYDPITRKRLMREIVEALIQPLNEEEKRTGLLEISRGPRLLPPDTQDNLQRYYRENGMTDYLPIILPTEERVAAMLKGTSHEPDGVVGRMAGGAFEPWQYTVEQVAINAVMAGAEPEYLPVILALASTGTASLYSSTNSFAYAVVINGPIRDEINMNYGIGALGPFNHANATIGRAWTLISKNLANGGIAGETYLGSQGNNLNYNNLVIAENEAKSPWKSFSVQMGFKPEESVLSIFNGLGIQPGQGAKGGGVALNPHYDEQFVDLMRTFTGLFGALIVCDPLVADFLKNQGYDTKEKLINKLYEESVHTVGEYKQASFVITFDLPRAQKGIEPFATWFSLPEDAVIRRFIRERDINIVVTGGRTQSRFQAGNLRYTTSVSIDKWR